MRQYRDKVLRKNPTGRAYVRLFYRHALEVTAILVKNPSIAADARNMLNTMEPEVKEAVQGRAITISQPELDGITSILNAISTEAGTDLKKSIQRITRDIKQKKILSGMGIKKVKRKIGKEKKRNNNCGIRISDCGMKSVKNRMGNLSSCSCHWSRVTKLWTNGWRK